MSFKFQMSYNSASHLSSSKYANHSYSPYVKFAFIEIFLGEVVCGYSQFTAKICYSCGEQQHQNVTKCVIPIENIEFCSFSSGKNQEENKTTTIQ